MTEAPGSPTVTTLDAAERAELARLRAEVETLRGRRPRRRIVWKSVAAGVVLVLGCLLVPIALMTVWVHNQVADTDRFVATTSPLIREPSVQIAVTDRVTDTVFQYVDVPALTTEALQALSAQGVPAAVTDRLQGLAAPLESSLRGSSTTAWRESCPVRGWRSSGTAPLAARTSR